MVLQNWSDTGGGGGGLPGVERPLSPQLNKLCQGLGPLALFCSPSACAWWLNASKFDLVMGKLYSFGTLGIMCNFKTRVWAHSNYFEIPSAKIHSKTFFFFFGDSYSVSSPSQSRSNQPEDITFSGFQQSLLKSSMCVHDKYTPVATCTEKQTPAWKYQGFPLFLCK